MNVVKLPLATDVADSAAESSAATYSIPVECSPFGAVLISLCHLQALGQPCHDHSVERSRFVGRVTGALAVILTVEVMSGSLVGHSHV